MKIAMDDVFLFFLIASLVGVVYYFPRDRYKRNTFIVVSILSFVLFGVAHDQETEKANANIEHLEITEEEVIEDTKEENEAEVKDEAIYKVFEFDEEIENNEEVEVRLLKIEKLKNENRNRDRIEAVFEIKNKTDRRLQVQAQAVSINDYMVNSSLYLFREEISSGKSVMSTLIIEDYQDQAKIPNLENNFEMTLDFFDWDDFAYQTLVDINVAFE